VRVVKISFQHTPPPSPYLREGENGRGDVHVAHVPPPAKHSLSIAPLHLSRPRLPSGTQAKTVAPAHKGHTFANFGTETPNGNGSGGSSGSDEERGGEDEEGGTSAGSNCGQEGGPNVPGGSVGKASPTDKVRCCASGWTSGPLSLPALGR
jgi:hypothetical protein